jgi:hypothetical protein
MSDRYLPPSVRNALRHVAVNGSTRRARHAACGGLLLAIVVTAASISSAGAATTPMVNLGTASAYAVLSGASVGNTVSAPGAPHTTLRGSLGVKANTQPTGFPPGVVTGAIDVGNAAAAAAHADLVAAYDEVASRTGGDTVGGALAGATIGPGLHHIIAAVSNTGTVTLDGGGDANAVFVFQVGGALAMAAASHVVLTGGARASRVFWQVNGAGAIGAGSTFAGTLMALDAVDVGNGSTVNGRAFARNGALTLDDNQFYSGPPAIALSGGATAYTTDTTPTISGTTDVEAPALVSLTINGQTLTAAPSAGAWSIDAPILPNGTYPVVATVVDGAGNVATATQSLTVDTVLPIITLDGGPAVATNDATPTLGGTSDVAAATVVHLTVGLQALTALVQPGGAWNISPATLAEGTYTVTATVLDPAGNAGTALQSLTIDTVPPALTITGGAGALTRDSTPQIGGNAAVATGTPVTVSLADETLTAFTLSGGTFAVTASALADGPHRVVVTVVDAAGNQASSLQTLTVDTVAPAVAIDGGPAASTTALAPTITGTSGAAPGTTITVVIGGQTMTALLQANGTWNTTPTALAAGVWPLSASAQDPAGNQGVAVQTLTIRPPASPLAGTAAPVVAVAAATAVAGARTQKVGRAALALATTVTTPHGGGVRAAADGVVRIRGSAKTIALARASRLVAAGSRATLTLVLKGRPAQARVALARVRAALARGASVTATITVRITDAAGTTRATVRVVKLTP